VDVGDPNADSDFMSSGCFLIAILLPFLPLQTLLFNTSAAANAAPFLLTNFA
jgi:hypothetical protein